MSLLFLRREMKQTMPTPRTAIRRMPPPIAKITGLDKLVGLEVEAPALLLAFASSAVAEPAGVESVAAGSVAVGTAEAPVSLDESVVDGMPDALDTVMFAPAAPVEMAVEADCEAVGAPVPEGCP